MSFSIASSSIYRQRDISTKIFSRRSLLGGSSCSRSRRCDRSWSRITMSSRSRSSTPSSRRMSRWCSISRTSIPRIKVLQGNTFSISWTRSSPNISRNAWPTPTSSAWLHLERIWRSSPSSSRSTGRSSSDRCHTFLVSFNHYHHHSHPHIFFTEKNGKMFHLLKSQSKPSKTGLKRKKVSIAGTFD